MSAPTFAVLTKEEAALLESPERPIILLEKGPILLLVNEKSPFKSLKDLIDRFVDSYAVRTAGMTASEVRALFAVASRPAVISLAGGMPYVAALPLVFGAPANP